MSYGCFCSFAKLTFNQEGVRLTSKTDYIKVAEERRRRASVQDDILEGPRPETWSAQMLAYCYTVLCPVVELQERPDKQIISGGERWIK